MKDCKVIEDKLFRYRLIFPIKNDDGSINWFNLFTGGSWGNIMMVTLIVLLCVGLVLAYKHDTAVLIECCNSACHSLKAQADGILPLDFNVTSFNIPSINLTG